MHLSIKQSNLIPNILGHPNALNALKTLK